MTSLTARVLRGGTWGLSGQLLARTLDLAAFLALARLLDPADFGLVGIAMTIVFIAEAILELPASTVLLVHAHPTQDMVDTAFTLGLLRAGVVFIIICSAGFVVSQVYADKRLFHLSAVLAVAPAARSLLSPQMVFFARRFNFLPQFVLDVSAKLAYLVVAVTFAWQTRSYWSIAFATIAAPIAMIGISYCFAPYRPRCSLNAWKVFSGFLGWNAVSQLIGAVNWQLDRLLLPKFATITQFGQYITASEIVALPIKAVALPIISPLFVAFSATNSSSTGAVSMAYIRALDTAVTVMFPVFAILAFFNEPLLVFLVGEKWRGAAPIITFLSLISMFAVPRLIFGPLCIALNRPKLISIVGFVELVIKALLLIILLPLMGINGALIAQGVAVFAALVTSAWLIKGISQVAFTTQILIIVRPLLGALMIYVTALILTAALPNGMSAIHSILGTGAAMFVSLAVYFGMVTLLWLVAKRPPGCLALLFSWQRRYFQRK